MDMNIDGFDYLDYNQRDYNQTKNNMKEEYYSQTSSQVLDVKKAFRITDKAEVVLNEYITNIKAYLDNIDVEKKRDKDDDIERKANELKHTMNMKKMDID